MRVRKRLPFFFFIHTLAVQQKERSQKTPTSVLVQTLSRNPGALICWLIFLNLSFLAHKVGRKKVITQYTKKRDTITKYGGFKIYSHIL